MFKEKRMIAEIVVFAVLKDKYSSRRHQRTMQHHFWKFGKFTQGIGRVGKNKFKTPCCTLDIAKRIRTYRTCGRVGKRTEYLTNEGKMLAVALNAHHLRTSARKEFERNASRSGKKVEGMGFIEIDICPKHIEEILLGKVRSRTCLKGSGHFKAFPLIFSCDDPHNKIFISKASREQHQSEVERNGRMLCDGTRPEIIAQSMPPYGGCKTPKHGSDFLNRSIVSHRNV